MRLLRVLPVVPLVLLTGCGVAGTEFHPGVAAQVGDETITTRHVDEITDDACQGLEKLNEGSAEGNSPTPLGSLAHQVTNALVQQLIAERLADEYDVTSTRSYKDGLTQAEAQLSSLSGAQKDAVLEVVDAQAYTQDILVQVGEIELDKQGTEDSAPQDQYNEGVKVLDAWAADHDVDINPKYSLELGSDGPVDTAVSVAVGDRAKDGLKADPGAGYTGALATHLVCFE